MYQNEFARPGMNGFNGYGYPLAHGSSEISLLQQRVDTLCAQLNQLTEIVIRKNLIDSQALYAQAGAGSQWSNGATSAWGNGGSAWNNGFGAGFGVQSGVNGQSVLGAQRIRESDSHLFWDISLSNLGFGDVEVEVAGNRVICRTRVPARTNFRTISATELPRGLDIFELSDGRLEFCWVIPVSFIGKEVEASCSEGRITICVPKAEVIAKHSVKIAKESVRKGSSSHEMTA